MFNKNMKSLGESRSVIRELFEYGKKLKEEIGEENVFDFTLGNPFVSCPNEVNESLSKLSFKDNIHGYTSSQGSLQARQKIATYNKNKYGFSLDENLIYLTCGAAASLKIVISSLIENSFDEVIAITPYFPEYKVFVKTSGGVFKSTKIDEENFLIDFESLDELITKNTKAVIINSPNNPSGVVYTEETIIKLSDLLLKKQKEFNSTIYIIADEPYREIVFDNVSCPFIPKYYDNTVICYSYSKALSLPGERIGYIAISPNAKYSSEFYLTILGSGRALGYVCAPSIFQELIALNIDKVCDFSIYKQNRDILISILEELNYKYVKPSGAFYLLLKTPTSNATKFSENAKKYGLLVVPTDTFGLSGYVRIATCVSSNTIINSKNAFTSLAKEYNLI